MHVGIHRLEEMWVVAEVLTLEWKGGRGWGYGHVAQVCMGEGHVHWDRGAMGGG